MDILTYGLLNKKVEETKNVSDEKITEAVNTYLDENHPATGATAEQAAQIDKNVADIDELKGDLSQLSEDIVKCTEQTLTDEQKNQVRENLGLYNEHLEHLKAGEVTFVNNESTFIIGNETDIKYILTLSNENKTYKFEGNITKTQIGPYDYEYSGTFNPISNNLPQDSSIIYNGGLLRFNSSQDINGTYTINIYNNLTTVIPINYLPMDSELSYNSSNPVENRVIKNEMDKKITSPSTAEVGQTIIVKSVDSNGKPTEWKTADLPNVVQPDWNQNDETAADYVKNRPFYEEVKLIAEGDITDDNLQLPEGKYELGKLYIVEVDGVQHQLEFTTTKSDEGFNYVGFNLIGTRNGITYIDSTKPLLFVYTTNPADGSYSLSVSNITTPAHVRVLCQDIRKIDAKYLPCFDFGISLVSSGRYSLTNLEQVQKAIDNNMMFNIVYSVTGSGVTSSFKQTLPCIKDCMVISDLSGNIIGNQYDSIRKLFNLEINLNADDYENGVITPTSAILYADTSYTLVKCYASPF